MAVTFEEHLAAIGNPMADALVAEGITPEKLAKQLKQELKAKVTKTAKVKGAVPKEQLGRCQRVVATSGVVVKTQDGEEFGTGDTIIAWEERAWDVQAKARMDAQRLMGMYPPERKEVSGAVAVEATGSFEVQAGSGVQAVLGALRFAVTGGEDSGDEGGGEE